MISIRFLVGVCPAAIAALVPLTAAASQDATDGIPRLPQTKARSSDGHVTVRAVRVNTPPRVDAVLDEAVYQSITPITHFIQQEPDEGELATEQTFVWILFDDKYLYVAARCRDSQPWRIVANDMRRDGRNVSQNDNFSIVFDCSSAARSG